MSQIKPTLQPASGSLSGRVALVTGSSSGIGEAVAHELARRGARVAITSRTLERAQPVAAEIASSGGAATAYAADLAQPAEAERLVGAVADAEGRLDILVNNAGVGMVRPSTELSLEDWNLAIALDLTAPFLCAQAAARRMIAAGGGVIVNIGSVFARVGMPKRAAYCAAKHGLFGLTKALATEWARDGVRVVQVDPGFVRTDLVQESMRRGGFDVEQVEDRTPLGRMADPQDVAGVVAFLVGDEAGYLTGSSVLADGGWVADGGW